VHENVLIPALCADIDCSGIAEEHPNLAKFLEVGGPMPLSDGERIDSYSRIFRWMQNRVLVPMEGDAISLAKTALKSNRNTVVFSVLGEPAEFDYVGASPDDVMETYEVGSTVTAGTVLWVRMPVIPFQAEAFEPPVLATVFRVHSDGVEEVAAFSTWDGWHQVVAEKPGAYYVEVWQTPVHLKASLGPLGHLSDTAYRWIVTNPLYVQ